MSEAASSWTSRGRRSRIAAIRAVGTTGLGCGGGVGVMPSRLWEGGRVVGTVLGSMHTSSGLVFGGGDVVSAILRGVLPHFGGLFGLPGLGRTG